MDVTKLMGLTPEQIPEVAAKLAGAVDPQVFLKQLAESSPTVLPTGPLAPTKAAQPGPFATMLKGGV